MSDAINTALKQYRSYLKKDEIAELRKPNNAKAIWMFMFNWGVIAACFSAIAWSESLLVILVALLVMAGRQLGLGILLHECSHRGFFPCRDKSPCWTLAGGHAAAGADGFLSPLSHVASQ